VPPITHLIYIPSVLLVGIVIGWVLGGRATRDAQAAAARAAEAKAARAAARRQNAAGDKTAPSE